MTDAFGIKTRGRGASNRIYTDGLRDIPVPQLPWVISDKGAKVLARDVHGKVVGIEKKLGRGKVRFFGFFVNYTIEEHPSLWSTMMQLPEVPRNVCADNDGLHLEARFADGEGVLFVGNFHRMPRTAHIVARNPRGGAPLDIGRITVEALTGLFLPLEKRLSAGATLVYAYGELLDRTAKGGRIRFGLCGHGNSAGRIVLRLKKKAAKITVDGKPVTATRQGDLLVVEYPQNGKRQIVEIR